MRCYLVKGADKRKYCGTQAQASEFKKELKEFGLKRSDITVTEVDIPDDKQGKLDFINSLIS